jgi:hypothetical protein
MTNRQIQSDIATEDRREMADKTLHDNRVRNDSLTRERRYMTDRTMDKSRAKNDETTANRRREARYGEGNTFLTVSLMITMFAILAVEAYLIFI